MRPRICVVASGALASCPRMLKAADALQGAGYRVRVVSVSSVGWNRAADLDLRRTRRWEWQVLRLDWGARPWTRAWTGVRQRAARAWATAAGGRGCSPTAAALGFSRTHRELVRLIRAKPADLLYGGTAGALAATAAAAEAAGVPYALDLEDFHSAEQDDSPDARLAHALIARIERAVLPGAAFLTAASAGIADAYGATYRLPRPLTINNTFPLPVARPRLDAPANGVFKLYWFGQRVGPRRGLEDVIRGMGVAGIPGELHLRGNPLLLYLEGLRRLRASVAPRLRLVAHAPASPDEMVALCAGYDVGLATEPGFSLNNRIALSNKAFTYILAGLPVAFTDTPGQRPLALDLGEGAILYRPGDVDALASGLTAWANDRAALRRARAAAWAAAKRRWHWEHPEERGALLAAVEKALDR